MVVQLKVSLKKVIVDRTTMCIVYCYFKTITCRQLYHKDIISVELLNF